MNHHKKIWKIMIDYVDRSGAITDDPGDRAKRALQRLKVQASISDEDFLLMLHEAKLAKFHCGEVPDWIDSLL